MSRFFDGQVFYTNLNRRRNYRKHLWSVIAILVGVTLLVMMVRPDWVILLP